MGKNESRNKALSLVWKAVRVLAFVSGGFLFFRARNRLISFVKNQNFIITAAYAVILAFIALFFRLIMMLNWIIQQGR
jgi:hypothetical protein